MDKWHSIKFLKPYLKPYRGKIIFAFFSMIVVAIATALSAYIMKPILNNIFTQKDEHYLYLIPLLIIAIFVTRGVFRFFSAYLTSFIGIEITNKIRQELFENAINAKTSNLEHLSTGDINTYIIQTVNNIKDLISKTIPSFISGILTIIALMGMILYLNWKLSMYAIILSIFILLPIRYLSKRVKKYVQDSEVNISKISNLVNEVFSNLDIVKVYNAQKLEQDKFDKYTKEYKNALNSLVKNQEASSPIMEFFIALAISSVIFFGGLMVIKNQMTTGDFFAFLTALMMLYTPIKSTTRNSLVLKVLDSYIARIEELLNIKKEPNIGENIDKIESIEFKDVSLTINGKTILNNISFKIEDKTSLAIVGKTGSGKSTIVALILGLREATSGDILINNKNIKNINMHSIREQISYVNQKAGIFNDTIKNNIIYTQKVKQDEYKLAKTQANCDFIDSIKEKDKYTVGEDGKKLSGGQKQRVALARAIYKQGSLFILDEATSALDEDTQKKVQESTQKILKENLSIIVAHRYNTIKDVDRVLVLSEGKVVKLGSFSQISNSKEFKQNFNIEDINA